MKRIVLFVLTAMLLLNTVPVLAASSSLVQAEGTITAVDTANNQITVTLSDKSEMVFNVSSSSPVPERQGRQQSCTRRIWLPA